MKRSFFNAKIHRATVTQADPDYEGSVTIDKNLLDASGILENEAIWVWNITRGSRLMTYVMEGERGSGIICLNGAAALLNQPGDLVILATFVDLEAHEIAIHKPTIVHVDAKNRVKKTYAEEVPGPKKRKAG